MNGLIDRLESTAIDKDGYSAKLPLWNRFRLLYHGLLVVFIVVCFAFPVLQETSLFSTNTAIRSALSLPIDAYLLERPPLLSKITAAFKDKKSGENGIKTVVLVGMGGMGKTTLVRHYARKQSLPVVFELSAHDSKTLLSSFSKLAFALAETLIEKKELESWQHIENRRDYQDKLLLFVSQKLRGEKAKTGSKQWLLIFDNVDQFEDIQSFLPQDQKVWGRGNVLITTRNEHITYSDRIDPDQVIAITPFSTEEQEVLFKKVLHRPLNRLEQKELQQFLTKIPPFPLDVMISAHYIKRTKINYSAYLDYLAGMHRQFETSQRVFLTRATSYDQNRYAIISNAVKQIMVKDEAFIPLLWIISHLGNGPIPKDLLTSCTNQLIVDRFIDELSRYSLLMGNFSDYKENVSPQICLHQSTQQNMRVYLQNTIDKKRKQPYNDTLIQVLEGYSHRIMMPPISLGDMKDFTIHLQALLSDKTNQLSGLHRSCIELLLGSFYCYLADSVMAKEFLEPILVYFVSYYKNNTHLRLLRAFMFAGMSARFSGDYVEAKMLLGKSLYFHERFFSVDAYNTHAITLRHLAYVYKTLAEYDKAKTAIERCIALYLKYAPHHSNLAMAFSELATIYYGGPGDYDKAIFYRLKSLKQEGSDHQHTLLTYGKLGMDYRRVGDYNKAKEVLAKSYAGFKKNYPHDADSLSWIATKFGEIYRLLGTAKQAEILLKEGVDITSQYFGKDHIHTDWSLIPLAQLYTEMGQYDKARELLEKSLKGPKRNLEIRTIRPSVCTIL